MVVHEQIAVTLDKWITQNPDKLWNVERINSKVHSLFNNIGGYENLSLSMSVEDELYIMSQTINVPEILSKIKERVIVLSSRRIYYYGDNY